MISPDIWGPHFWSLFHFITIKYPNNPSTTDMYMMEKLIHSIAYCLPCAKCSKHFTKTLQTNLLKQSDLKSKNNIMEWFILIHNIVNKSLNKKELSENNAKNRINVLYHTNYIENLKKVILYIEEGLEINHNVDIMTCNKINHFIDASLYFAEIYGINFIFTDYKTFKYERKKLFSKI